MHYTHRLSQARIHQIVGWFVLVPVLILAGVLFVVGKNENLFEEKYKITTVFSEGYGLKVGYPVMLLGVQVGRIGAIEFTEQNNAQFTLNILKKYQDKIRADSKAVIGKSGGLFGEPQIEITPGRRVNRSSRLEGTSNPMNPSILWQRPKYCWKPWERRSPGSTLSRKKYKRRSRQGKLPSEMSKRPRRGCLK